jgi:hypothetical protein
MLNATFSLFVSLDGQLSVYPVDNSRHIFTHALNLLEGEAQIVTHRDGALLYYMYIRRLSSKKDCIGLSVLLNDRGFTDYGMLFELFENTLTHEVLKEQWLYMTSDGKIDLRGRECLNEKNTKGCLAELRARFQGAELSVRQLPAVANAVSVSEHVKCSVRDTNENLFRETTRSTYAVIRKDKQMGTELENYRRIVRQLDEATRKERNPCGEIDVLELLASRNVSKMRRFSLVLNVSLFMLIFVVAMLAIIFDIPRYLRDGSGFEILSLFWLYWIFLIPRKITRFLLRRKKGVRLKALCNLLSM